MYDIIGDIHGHAEPLKSLLRQMGYAEKNGVWQHPTRKCIFVGDYIDRGPAIRETLQIVRRMTEEGHALAIMGNHEFNALGFHTRSENGDFLRVHNAKNTKQHAQTLAEFFYHQHEWQEYLQWFYSLPLFVELEGLRLVHACWDDAHMDFLSQHANAGAKTNAGDHFPVRREITLTPEFLLQAHDRGSKEYNAIEDVLKGKEVDVPEEHAWEDKDGHKRTRNRLKWWRDPQESTHDELLFQCPPGLQDVPFEKDIQLVVYSKDAPPVFFGHYWLDHDAPSVMSHNVVCLDYSVAKEGFLAAYRWNPGQPAANENFVVSGSRTKHQLSC